MKKCDAKTEVFARISGYFQPVARWNDGKKSEFSERKEYNVNEEILDTKIVEEKT